MASMFLKNSNIFKFWEKLCVFKDMETITNKTDGNKIIMFFMVVLRILWLCGIFFFFFLCNFPPPPPPKKKKPSFISLIEVRLIFKTNWEFVKRLPKVTPQSLQRLQEIPPKEICFCGNCKKKTISFLFLLLEPIAYFCFDTKGLRIFIFGLFKL